MIFTNKDIDLVRESLPNLDKQQLEYWNDKIEKRMAELRPVFDEIKALRLNPNEISEPLYKEFQRLDLLASDLATYYYKHCYPYFFTEKNL